MKSVIFPLSLVLLSACHTRSQESREPVQAPLAAESTAPELDFSDFQDRSMTVEEFVKACQERRGFNFMYTESTQSAMRAKSLRLAGPERVPASEFGGFLAAQLGGCGFTCEPVGPEHLHVLLIQPRPM
jgi:hypothetical protein